MKTSKAIFSVACVIIAAAAAASTQRSFVQTVTVANQGCNGTCTILDIPENVNPYLIVFAKSIPVNGVDLNPHIGAYYMWQNKWSILNIDGAALMIGAKFSVEYYGNGDGGKAFSYSVPSRPHPNDPAYIDYAELNNNSNAQVKIFPSSPPGQVNALFSHKDVKVEYNSAGAKWSITNVDSTPVPAGLFYNVAYSPGSSFANPKANKNIDPKPPTSNSPNGQAGGDLDGNFPDPRVIGLQGKPISSSMPNIGQTLRWNGTQWAPLPDPVSATSLPPNGSAGGDLGGTYPAPNVQKLSGRTLSNAAPTVGQVLKWSGTAWEPSAETVGTSGPATSGSKPSVLFYSQIIANGAFSALDAPNINTLSIPGLDNQSFTLTQSSRVVHYTTVVVENSNHNAIQAAVNVWLTVEIQNTSGAMVSRAVCETVLGVDNPHTLVAVGGSLLPAGNYHTRITVNRGVNGSSIVVWPFGFGYGRSNQGGQTIIQIFPEN